MIRSMTGFGKGSVQCPYGEITAEIKTLNHKSLSVNCMPFEGLFFLEEKIKNLFNGKVLRGKVFVRITRESTDKQKPLKKVVLNEPLAEEYLKKIKRAQKNLLIKGDLEVRDLVEFPGVVECGSESVEKKLWPHIKKATETALKDLVEYREQEGKRLAKDLKQRTQKIKKALKDVKKYGKKSVEEYRDKLTKTVNALSNKIELDKGRLETEVALFARNCDITEEMIRLEQHLSAYKASLERSKDDIGKKLDFIAQEMHREANTMSAKSSDFRVAKAVIEIKSEIEKMREQLKNIE